MVSWEACAVRGGWGILTKLNRWRGVVMENCTAPSWSRNFRFSWICRLHGRVHKSRCLCLLRYLNYMVVFTRHAACVYCAAWTTWSCSQDTLLVSIALLELHGRVHKTRCLCLLRYLNYHNNYTFSLLRFILMLSTHYSVNQQMHKHKLLCRFY
jgi:hypothetical protein